VTSAFSSRAAILATILALGGCASFSPDAGLGGVNELVQARTGQRLDWQPTDRDPATLPPRVTELLGHPLTSDAAVEIALANSPRLRSTLQELRIAESDLVRAGTLPNPRFSFTNIAGGGIREIERTLMVELTALFMMPLALDLEQRRFELTQLRVASELVAAIAEVRTAYVRAVASLELVTYAQQVKETAEASSELARRMVVAGNFSRLAQMREQAFYADAVAQLARTMQEATTDRERLARLLGLTRSSAITLPDRLPDLPRVPREPRDAEQTAMEQRLDILYAKRSLATSAMALSLTRTTRFVNLLEVGYANKSQTGEPRQNGYAIELEVPLFDFGTTRVARADAIYSQALHDSAEVAVNALSEVRETYTAYRTAYDLAKHYQDEIVPLRKRISDEAVLRYNGMLISVFELLADARDQIGSVIAAIEAKRDYWVADAHLQAALTGRAPGDRLATSGASTRTTAPSRGH